MRHPTVQCFYLEISVKFIGFKEKFYIASMGSKSERPQIVLSRGLCKAFSTFVRIHPAVSQVVLVYSKNLCAMK